MKKQDEELRNEIVATIRGNYQELKDDMEKVIYSSQDESNKKKYREWVVFMDRLDKAIAACHRKEHLIAFETILAQLMAFFMTPDNDELHDISDFLTDLSEIKYMARARAIKMPPEFGRMLEKILTEMVDKKKGKKAQKKKAEAEESDTINGMGLELLKQFENEL